MIFTHPISLKLVTSSKLYITKYIDISHDYSYQSVIYNDALRLIQIAEYIQNGKWEEAKTIFAALDSVVKEQVPLEVKYKILAYHSPVA